MSWTGISPMPASRTPCSRIAAASSNPNARQAPSAGMARQVPTIKAAKAM